MHDKRTHSISGNDRTSRITIRLKHEIKT